MAEAEAEDERAARRSGKGGSKGGRKGGKKGKKGKKGKDRAVEAPLPQLVEDGALSKQRNKLQKALAEVAALEARKNAQGGAGLEPGQLAKLRRRGELEEALRGLRLQGSAEQRERVLGVCGNCGRGGHAAGDCPRSRAVRLSPEAAAALAAEAAAATEAEAAATALVAVEVAAAAAAVKYLAPTKMSTAAVGIYQPSIDPACCTLISRSGLEGVERPGATEWREDAAAVCRWPGARTGRWGQVGGCLWSPRSPPLRRQSRRRCRAGVANARPAYPSHLPWSTHLKVRGVGRAPDLSASN